ncbi:hypothetical protein GCK32_006272 [Trichostrongylus colubriformis]|uniref:Uncharacterized protein n=1 Tax=Trichostrongylus colubriformis TaxID=6319 RepID=A0AAN8F7E8_TRICO
MNTIFLDFQRVRLFSPTPYHPSYARINYTDAHQSDTIGLETATAMLPVQPQENLPEDKTVPIGALTQNKPKTPAEVKRFRKGAEGLSRLKAKWLQQTQKTLQQTQNSEKVRETSKDLLGPKPEDVKTRPSGEKNTAKKEVEQNAEVMKRSNDRVLATTQNESGKNRRADKKLAKLMRTQTVEVPTQQTVDLEIPEAANKKEDKGAEDSSLYAKKVSGSAEDDNYTITGGTTTTGTTTMATTTEDKSLPRRFA